MRKASRYDDPHLLKPFSPGVFDQGIFRQTGNSWGENEESIMGSEYTSYPFDSDDRVKRKLKKNKDFIPVQPGWGLFITEAADDVRQTGIF